MVLIVTNNTSSIMRHCKAAFALYDVLYLILADIALWIIWISIFKPFPTQCQADNMKKFIQKY